MEFSIYQKRIFESVTSASSGAWVIEAVAGSGKTTTIQELYKMLSGTSQFFAFNKSIAEELKKRGIPASTMHSFGLIACKQAIGNRKIDDWKVVNLCRDMQIERKDHFVIKKFCSLGKAYLLRPGEVTRADWESLADHFDIEVKAKDLALFYQNVSSVYGASFNTNVIDFDDMIALPIFNNWPITTFHNVLVDEAQDLNPARLELVSRAVGPCGKFIAVGDSRQAIYGFCGADNESMEKISTRFNAIRLPLSICYRCPKAVIEEAKHIVPHIEASPTADEGKVVHFRETELDKHVKGGDFILCRCTAPIVSKCFDFIRRGIPALVKGKDIGQDLIYLVDKIAENTNDLESFVERAVAYKAAEIAKLQKVDREMAAELLSDKIETLLVLCEGIRSVFDLKNRIEKLFVDVVPENVICLSTVHKAKGLEKDNVFILRPDLLPHPAAKQEWQQKQEMNLLYVAITRAKQNLYFVSK